MFQFVSCVSSIVGLYVISFYLYDNLKTPVILLFYAIKRIFGYDHGKSLIQKYGKWAAITGATDGIGKAYARELARRGLNVILISRTKEKLEKVANEIEHDFGVETKTIVADFTKGKEVCHFVEQELENTTLRILINNVGQSTPEPGRMMNFTDEELWNVINTNIGPVTQLSRYLLNRLRKAREPGIIVNVSSGSEHVALPSAAVYAATKAYMRSLTLALQEEARNYGISLQLLSPFFVVTNINSYSKGIMRGGLFIPDADTFARSAVDTLDKVDRTTGYPWHGLQVAIAKAMNSRLRQYVLKTTGRRAFKKSKFRRQVNTKDYE